MAPIRTAIIGLSSSGGGWATSAHLPYLLSPAGRARFQIVALCNSSEEAARKAIAAHGLPAETRAYGRPEDLAADSDVQFVVVNTRVDRHYETALPSVRAGKDVYVEWPLAHNAAHAAELADLARAKGGRTVVGLQGMFAPQVLRVREIIESGRIGKVLSSEARGSGGVPDRTFLPSFMKYFADASIGGNAFTIIFGHLFDFIQSALGNVEGDLQSRLHVQRPEVKIQDVVTKEIVETVRTEVPDLIIATGSLQASAHVQAGATLLLRYRRGQPFKGEPGFVWTVTGEKGEIRVTVPNGPTLNASAENGDTVEVYDFATDSVEDVGFSWPEDKRDLPVPARNIGSVYEAFTAGDESKYATFDHALKRHRQLEQMAAKFPGK